MSLRKLKLKHDVVDFCVFKEISLVPGNRAILWYFLPAIVLSKGQLGEPTVCHCKAGHLHYNLAPEPGSTEKNISRLMFLWGFYSNCLVDHPYKLLQMLNSQRSSHMLLLWREVWAAQINETADISLRVQKILLVCATKSLSCNKKTISLS